MTDTHGGAKLDRELRVRTRLSIGLVSALLLGVGGWGAFADLSGAVMAQGQLVVHGNVKKIQHPQGGVVTEIRVASGQRVKEGEVVLRLDGTQLRAHMAILHDKLRLLAIEQARLESEREGRDHVSFDAVIANTGERLGTPGFDSPGHWPSDRDEDAVRSERRLFEARRAARIAQRARLAERLVQIDMEMRGAAAQQAAKSSELKVIETDLVTVEGLWRKKLTTMARVSAVRRERARFSGELVTLEAQAARAGAQINELRQHLAEIDQRWLGTVQGELRDVKARAAELKERMFALEDQLRRVDLKSPIEGIVHELGQHTIGGVVRAGETAMTIVPVEAPLLAEVRVAPGDIDQVHQGQAAFLRLAAFSRRTTPELKGTVATVGADLTQDRGTAYFSVRIRIDDHPPADVRLQAGMPLESFIETERRQAWSYFIKPVSDNLARAFRER